MLENKRKSPMIIASVFMLIFLGIIYAWSVFKAQINLVFTDYTASQLSLNFTFTMITFCLGGFCGGKISSRWSQRISIRIAAVMLFAGFMGTSFMDGMDSKSALVLMYVCYGVISGFGTGIGYNACITGVAPWYPERMGLVSGILLMGFGLGSLILGLLANALHEIAGGIFGVFRIYAVAIASVLLAGSFFIKKPLVVQKKPEASDDRLSRTPAEILAYTPFWIYFLWNVIMNSAGLLVINSSANIAVHYGVAAGLGLAVSIFNGIGRPIAGMLVDKLGRFRCMLIINAVLIFSGVLMLVMAQSGGVTFICIGMFLVGTCYGGGITLQTKLAKELFGPKYFAINVSLTNFCIIPASFIGPYVSGLLQDRSGGDYSSTFILLTVIAVIALATMFLLDRRLTVEAGHTARA